MPLSSCDDDHLRFINEVENKLDEARQLAENGELEQSLECYLFAFDNSEVVPGWGGVRLSYIPAEIAQIGTNLPAALDALRHRRDARESMIRSGETNYGVVSEWLSLNRYLEDQEREINLLDELDSQGKLAESLKFQIIRENYERLLKDGKYDALAPYFNDFGRQFFAKLFHHDCETLLPESRHSGLSRMEARTFWLEPIKDEGAKLYELALGVKKWQQADEVSRRVLLYCKNVDAYNVLADIARRLNRKARLKTLYSQARKLLPAEELNALCR